jgi:hypothetical protein
MSLGRYAMECEGLADELRDSLTEAEVVELHRLLSGRSVNEWVRWRCANSKRVSSLVAATPGQRKAPRLRKDKLFLTMAGIQHCLEAQAILRAVDGHFLEPGGSYREMAARAGEAYDQMYEFEIPNWPFDMLDSPFTDDTQDG